MTFTVTATEELEGEAVDTEAYVTDANNQGDKKWQPAGVDIYEKEFEFTKSKFILLQSNIRILQETT